MSLHTTPDSYTKLLIHSDDPDGTSFIDSSASQHTITRGGDAYHKATQKKFGSSSIELDGSDDHLAIADHDDWNFGTGDFTIDFWIMRTASTTQMIPFGGGTTDVTANWFAFRYENGWNIQPAWWGAERSGASGSNWDINKWYHVAFVGTASNVYFYVNGVIEGSGTRQGVNYDLHSWKIGHSTNIPTGWGNANFQGYIDEFRVSKGIARWTDSFVPPNKPYSVIDDDFVTDVAGIEDESSVTTVGKDFVVKSDPDEASTDSVFSISNKTGGGIMEVQEGGTIIYGDQDNNPGSSQVRQRVYKLQGGTVTDVTIDPLALDNNAMYEIIYVSHHYNAGQGTGGWRYLRWHGYDGSGGSGDVGGDNWHIILVENTGTGESTDVPVWTVSGGIARLTYGNGYMGYRTLFIKSYTGYTGFRDV
jgi:hypothetical protein